MGASTESLSAPSRAAGPRLEVGWSSGWRNLQETVRALRTPLPLLPPQVALTAFRPGPLVQGWPGRALLASGLFHILFVVTPLPQFLTRPPAQQTALNKIRIEYDLRWTGGSRLLPPISPSPQPKRRPNPGRQKNEPLPPRGADAVQRQTIVSNPPEPNHPRQTLLTQFGLEKARVAARDLRLPNMVIPPAPTAAPLPEVNLRRLRMPEGAQAPLPPRPKSASELALEETRLENLYPKLAVKPGSAGQTAAPAPDAGGPPAVDRSGDLTVPGIVALSARPALPSAVLELPGTNLRARFATGPAEGSGRPDGTPGAPGGSGGGPGGDGGGSGGLTAPDILVTSAGPVPTGPVIVGPETALPPPATPPASARESGLARRTEPQPTRSPQERAQEILQGLRPGSRPGSAGAPRVYTIYINMPNLNSQTGSWVLRFSELGEASSTAAGGAANGFAVEAPIALKKVDPRYPATARRQHVEGSVFLYGIIRHDGTVENVEVVRSVHALLDQSAVAAFQRWRFQPGRKNGAPVNVEVVVEIPFRLSKLF